MTVLNLTQTKVATGLIADGCDPATANRIAAGMCPQCGGAVTETHSPAGIYGRCVRPWSECQGEYATAYPPNEETPAVLADGAGVSTEEQRFPIYSTAPDPDAWSTHDQLEWEESFV